MKLPRYKDLSPDQKKIFSSLTCAKRRCTDRDVNSYYRYGRRGIRYLLENSKTRIQVVLEQEESWLKAKKKYPNQVITINRIDSDGDYTEENIEWISRSENSKQMNKEHGGSAGGMARRKRVKCLTTGEEYESAREAWRQTGIYHSHICDNCNGKRKSAGKARYGKKRVWIYT